MDGGITKKYFATKCYHDDEFQNQYPTPCVIHTDFVSLPGSGSISGSPSWNKFKLLNTGYAPVMFLDLKVGNFSVHEISYITF